MSTTAPSDLLHDVTFACRQMLRNPGFTIVAIATLALGIGATSAIFSAVQAVVLEPLPVPDPGRIVAVHEFWRGNRGNVSAGNYIDAVAASDSFTHSTAIQYSSFNLGDASDAERIIGARATAGFFGVFATQPALGRIFTAADDQPGHEQVVVLSHRLWAGRFHSDRGVVGRRISMSGRSYDVIGVMPASFDFTENSEQLWVPIAFTAERKATHDEHYLQIGVRMALGATRRDVLLLVIRQAAWPVAIGIVAGIVMSAAATRVLSAQLFSVTPGDPLTFAAVAVGLTAIAILASLVPACRAASVDPTKALHMN